MRVTKARVKVWNDSKLAPPIFLAENIPAGGVSSLCHGSSFLAKRDIAANHLVQVISVTLSGDPCFYMLSLREPKHRSSSRAVVEWFAAMSGSHSRIFSNWVFGSSSFSFFLWGSLSLIRVTLLFAVWLMP